MPMRTMHRVNGLMFQDLLRREEEAREMAEENSQCDDAQAVVMPSRDAITRIINGIYGIGSGTYAGGHQDKSIARAVDAILKLFAAQPPAAPVETDAKLQKALKKLIFAVKTYQFTPEDAPEKAMAARDLDDILDDARALLASIDPATAPVGPAPGEDIELSRSSAETSEVQVSYDLAREDGELTVATVTRVFENGCKVLAHFQGDDAEAFIDAWNGRPR